MKTIFILAMTAALAACAGKVDEQAVDSGGITLPEWVTSPAIEDGIAATSCVKWSGDFDLDKKQAIANARQDLAQQIRIRVESMDETMKRNREGAGKADQGSVFTSVSRQTADQHLKGAVPQRVKPVKFDDAQRLCAQVAMKPEQTRELFDTLIRESKVQLSAKDEDLLFEEFKADQARQRMDEALSR